jgi:hypothetical protein
MASTHNLRTGKGSTQVVNDTLAKPAGLASGSYRKTFISGPMVIPGRDTRVWQGVCSLPHHPLNLQVGQWLGLAITIFCRRNNNE